MGLADLDVGRLLGKGFGPAQEGEQFLLSISAIHSSKLSQESVLSRDGSSEALTGEATVPGGF